jgi:Rps23 Pro-64 3,4-dihydroxylase Tpa1-like proline 4-hydroxylase
MERFVELWRHISGLVLKPSQNPTADESDMTFLATMQTNGFLSLEDAMKVGGDLRERYVEASPFPHIMIDDFLPEEVAEACLAHFPSNREVEAITYNRDQERLKTQYNPDTLPGSLRGLFYAFNSRPFLRVLENITGIKGLIPDPYFLGAGFHEIGQGGFLSMHADFNHHKPMNLERRINNKDWTDAYGGQLELWDDKMEKCEVSIVPTFNRCVIFNTTSRSWHGNPQPVNHPAGVTRKSIALYYYTSTWSDTHRDHTTQFRARPGAGDKIDWEVRRVELINDLLPPVLLRSLRKMRGKAKPEPAAANP